MKSLKHGIPAIFGVAILLLLNPAQANLQQKDPLPSWKNGPTKHAIFKFVKAVTTKGSPDFVPVEDRIATFDNDGTLWCEQPLIQGVFALDRLKELAKTKPEFKTKQPFKAALEGDKKYLHEAGEKAIMEIMAATHTGMTQQQFQGMVAKFFQTAKHPRFDVLYKKMNYQPMVELLAYLRANGFQTYICSGGGIYFMRVVSEEIYCIGTENVIGSSPVTRYRLTGGMVELIRLAKLASFNDKEEKPVNINLHIGKIPILAAGNVRSGGDIAMLTYCQSNKKRRTLQLLVNHDDAKREYAYTEKGNESLNAAKKNGWNVVSMRNDWNRVFAFEK